MKKINVFAYYRTSTDDLQADNWETQKSACEKYAVSNGLNIIEEFVEQVSAFKERPQFEKMLLRLKEVSGILVFDLDRLVRDPIQLGKIIMTFQETKKRIFQISGTLDLDSDEDRLLARIKTDIAQYETEKLKRRVKAGIQRHIEKYGTWGRKRKISEYQFKKWIEIDPETSKERLMLNKTAIAKMLGVHKTTLNHWMKKNGYGHLIGSKPAWLKKKRLEGEEKRRRNEK
jgi:site-specific DNA recombinase